MTFAGALDTSTGMQVRAEPAQPGSDVVVGGQGSLDVLAGLVVVPVRIAGQVFVAGVARVVPAPLVMGCLSSELPAGRVLLRGARRAGGVT